MKTLSTLIIGSMMAAASFAAQTPAPAETKTPAPATTKKAAHKKNHKKAVRTVTPAVAAPVATPAK